MSEWSGDELTLPEVAAPLLGESSEQLTATVLYHPDPERIGETAALLPFGRSGVTAISRLAPAFAKPGETSTARPLADTYLSRSPLEVRGDENSLMLAAPPGKGSIRVDGRPFQAEARYGWEQLRQGLLVALSHRVVLLLHASANEPSAPVIETLVGECCALRRVRALVGRVGATDSPVLLLGETGTGKELVARAIHAASERGGRALVSVNMAALSPDLAAAELFGVQRGAYTGAEQDRPGVFGRADQATLFLDEIGACPTAVQPQLLRALQQGEVQPPGGATRLVDVRVIAATDEDLDAPDCRFSAALRHRLAGFELRLPALRERREDLGRLLRHFCPSGMLERAANNPREVSRWVGLVEKLALYRWPGNVRELGNVCQQLSIASTDTGELAVPDSLSRLLDGVPATAGGVAESAAELTDLQIREAMLASRWEVAEAARELRISRQALYRRIEAIPELRVAADLSRAEVEAVYHQCEGDLTAAAQQLQVSRAALRRRWRALDLVAGGY